MSIMLQTQRTNKRQVGSAEHAYMVERVIESVDPGPVLRPFPQWVFLLVAPIELLRERAEQLRHGNISLPVAVVDGRINENRLSFGSEHVITAPQITMEKTRMFRLNDMITEKVNKMKNPIASASIKKIPV